MNFLSQPGLNILLEKTSNIFLFRVDEMRKPVEKRLGLPSKDYPTDLPFHKHFENLLSLVD